MPSLELVDAILKEFRTRNDVPAIGASIVDSNGESISHVVGVRRRDLPEQALVSDKWHIGSCTKSITAALWARLVELGLAKWDTPLPQIFEGSRSVNKRWKDVTIHHALQCRAGFAANLPRDVFNSSWKDTRPLPEQRADIVEQCLQRPPNRPGRFRYSNLSYIVVGAAIDRVAQTSFEKALELYLLQPLSIRTAGFGAPEAVCGHRPRVTLRSVGLFKGPPTRPDEFQSDNPRVYSSAGCLHLCLDDWSTLMRVFLASDDGVLLHEESLNMIFHPPAKAGQPMAIGWMRPAPSAGIPYFMQGSNTLWSATSMLALDRERCAMAVCNDGRWQVLLRSIPLANFLLTL